MTFAASTDLILKSKSFDDGTEIPREYTKEGQNVSPQLSWSGAPDATKSFAIICHDPDAPLVEGGHYGFVHWVLYNIPASVTELEQGTDAHTPGSNDFDGLGYGGPMPPESHGTHRYYFWVLALEEETKFEKGLTLWQLLEKVEPHLLAMNRLVGSYERQRKTP